MPKGGESDFSSREFYIYSRELYFNIREFYIYSREFYIYSREYYFDSREYYMVYYIDNYGEGILLLRKRVIPNNNGLRIT